MGLDEMLGSLGGGIAGNIAAGGARGHGQALTDEAIAAINGAKVPTDLASQIYFQQLHSAGQLTPAQEQALNIAQSQQAQVKANPQLQSAQMQALQALKGLSNTGMSSADRARLNDIQQQQATQAEGQKQQIMQNFAQRGEAGSGNELMSQLMAGQNAANQAHSQGLNVAANAQQNALQALGQYGTQAGAMNTQQFGQQSQQAEAQDALNRFNMQNQQSQQARNVANQNAAQQYNLQNQQGIQNANTGMYNQGLLMQRQGEQQQFQDALQKGQALSGAQFKGADAYNTQAGNTAQNWLNMGTGAGKLIGGMDFSGGAKNTMGTSAQSGGLTQGSADALSNYQFEANGGTIQPNHYAMGGDVPSEDCYAQGGTATGGADGLHSAVLAAMPYLARLAGGGNVPGKAPQPGNSYENDTVHAMLSPGEIVIPRSITQSPHAAELSKKFVECEIKKRGQ